MYFRSDYDGWQYVSRAVVPKQPEKKLESVKVAAAYDYNTGTAYFDQISLRREPVQTYAYGSDGKLVEAGSSGNGKKSYEYQTGTHLLKKYTGMDGVSTSLTYGNSTHNILTSESGSVRVTNTYTGSPVSGGGNGARTGAVYSSRIQGTSGGKYLETSSSYTADNESLASATDSAGLTAVYTYSGRRLVREQYGRAHATNYTYDEDTGRMLTAGSGSTILVTAGYDHGDVKTVTRTASGTDDQRYTYHADPFGNVTSITVERKGSSGSWSAPRELIRNVFTASVHNGELDHVAYPDGDHVYYEYDLFGRMTKERYNGETDSGDPDEAGDGETEGETAAHYVYSSEGDLAEQYVTENGGTVTEKYSYVYDSLGRLIRSREERNGSTVDRTEHIYNMADRLTGQSWQLGNNVYSESYTYDGNGNLSIFAPAAGNALNLSYDSLNRLTGISGGPYTKDISYRDISSNRTTLNVSGITYTMPGSHGHQSFGYTYYKGNIKTENGSNFSGTVTYSYDARNRIQTVENDALDGEETFTYDGADNLTFTTRRDADGALRSHTYAYNDPSWTDLLTAYDGRKIAYEGQVYNAATGQVTGSAVSGNPVSYDNGTRWDLTWEKGKQLKTASSGSLDIAYSYDINGIRKNKTVGDTSYEYVTQNGQVVRQTWGNHVLDIIYDNNCAPYALRYSADGGSHFSDYYYVLNLQGDVTGLVDSDGEMAAVYRYDVWGRNLAVLDDAGTAAGSDSIAVLNPLRYRGYYYDSETGLYYLNSRYYDPETGRFINADEAEYSALSVDSLEDTNLFAYCGNNPVMRVDPDGTLSNGWKVAVTGTILVASVAVIVATGGVASGPVMCVALSASEGAITGAATGAAQGAAVAAVTGAVRHRLATGSWKGAGKAAVSSAKQGAIDGAFSGAISGAIAGALHPTHCFVAGTAVLTATGYTVIEEIRAGDLVWSWDEDTGETALKEVTQTFVNQTDELVHLTIGNNTIDTTPGHPFYVAQKGWYAAESLRAGDILVTVNGEYVILEQVQHEILEQPITVYNFEVWDYHTYFVCKRSIAVHNHCISTHGNSLNKKETQLYALRDRDTHVIKKIGETTRGLRRYTRKYYDDHNVYMYIIDKGSKRAMHFQQHRLLQKYYSIFGRLPELNKSFW